MHFAFIQTDYMRMEYTTERVVFIMLLFALSDVSHATHVKADATAASTSRTNTVTYSAYQHPPCNTDTIRLAVTEEARDTFKAALTTKSVFVYHMLPPPI